MLSGELRQGGMSRQMAINANRPLSARRRRSAGSPGNTAFKKCGNRVAGQGYRAGAIHVLLVCGSAPVMHNRFFSGHLHAQYTGWVGAGSLLAGRCRIATHLFFHFLLHLLGRRFSNVRRDHPNISLGIDDRSPTIAPKHIHNWPLSCRS